VLAYKAGFNDNFYMTSVIGYKNNAMTKLQICFTAQMHIDEKLWT
jgi:hypothetical protein